MEHKHTKRWFGMLVLIVGLIHLLADHSAKMEFFSKINPATSMLVLSGIYLTAVKKNE